MGQLKNVLQLNPHREYFAQIVASTKRIVYRDQTPYWKKRLEGRDYVVIQFRNGYATEAPELQEEFLCVRQIRKWDKPVYAIRLGRILKIEPLKPSIGVERSAESGHGGRGCGLMVASGGNPDRLQQPWHASSCLQTWSYREAQI